MIETTFKSKISHLESFPLGAKEISEALGGSPQEEMLALSFHRWSAYGWRWRRGVVAFPHKEKQGDLSLRISSSCPLVALAC